MARGRPTMLGELEEGQRFGAWTVVAPVEGTRKYTCRCRCGVERDIGIHGLLSGRYLGCPTCTPRNTRLQVQPGEVYGQWTVIETFRREYRGAKKRYARCRCACGAEADVVLAALPSGRSSSCRDCAAADRSNFRQTGALPGWYWNRLHNNAKIRGLEVGVSIEYAWRLFEQQEGRCALTGLELVFGRKRTDTTASLDRVDSAVGYVEGNVQWVHKDVNQMKMGLEDDRFFELCRLIARGSP